MVFKKLLKAKKDADGDGPSTSADAAAEEQTSFHPDADEAGGMLCTNDELLKQQREAIMQWVKSMGKRLLTGNINLISTPFPVNIFEPRSYLEKLADVWVYPRYLADASQSSDPVERMKLVTTWFVAGLHHAFENWRKPFNPILGETWQATLSDGTTMSMEQISHHPPVSAFHMEGPGGAYRFLGLSQPTVSIVVKYYGFKTVAKGFRYVDFPDGTRIELHYPQYYIKNVVYGSSRPRAEVDGQAILVDVRNKLKTVINFGALKGARNKVLRRADAVYGFIYDCRNNQASLAEKTSTADLAETLDREQIAAAGARTSILQEDDEFESASENEYDSEKEDADTTAALERAAAEAAAAEGRDADATVSGPAVDEKLLPAEGSGMPSGRGAIADGTSRSSLNGADMGIPTSFGPGHRTPGSTSGSSGNLFRADTASSSKPSSTLSSGSFFTMSTLNRMGTLLRINQPPQTALVDPIPNESEGFPLASIEGSWLSHLNINSRRYWSVATEVPDRWEPIGDPLPSDSRFRQDLMVLEAGDMKGAQRAKELLENMQRHDKKLRETAVGSRYGSGH